MTLADIVARRLKFGGLPLVELSHDPSYAWRHGPDERVVERSEYLFREEYRVRSFTAPLFHWRFADGRQFSGRPKLKLQRKTWAGFLCGGERYAENGVGMLDELWHMILRSFSDGADDAPPIGGKR